MLAKQQNFLIVNAANTFTLASVWLLHSKKNVTPKLKAIACSDIKAN